MRLIDIADVHLDWMQAIEYMLYKNGNHLTLVAAD
jgi:hypothetical protein